MAATARAADFKVTIPVPRHQPIRTTETTPGFSNEPVILKPAVFLAKLVAGAAPQTGATGALASGDVTVRPVAPVPEQLAQVFREEACHRISKSFTRSNSL
jgi:hypothetical protein